MKYVTISRAAEIRGTTVSSAQAAAKRGDLVIAVEIEGVGEKKTVGVTLDSVMAWMPRTYGKKRKSKKDPSIR